MLVTDRQEFLARWLWDRALIAGPPPREGVYIGNELSGLIRAVVGYTGYSKSHSVIFAHIAGQKGYNWLTKDFLWFLFAYPFIQLNVQTMAALISSDNKKSINFVRKLGFEFVAVRYCCDLELRLYRLEKQDCKYLNINKGF